MPLLSPSFGQTSHVNHRVRDQHGAKDLPGSAYVTANTSRAAVTARSTAPTSGDSPGTERARRPRGPCARGSVATNTATVGTPERGGEVNRPGCRRDDDRGHLAASAANSRIEVCGATTGGAAGVSGDRPRQQLLAGTPRDDDRKAVGERAASALHRAAGHALPGPPGTRDDQWPARSRRGAPAPTRRAGSCRPAAAAGR